MKKNIVQIFLEKIFSRGQSDTSPSAISPITQKNSSSAAAASVIDTTESVASLNLADQLYTGIAQSAHYIYVFETRIDSIIPVGMICSSHSGVAGETGYIKLANGDVNAAPSGITGGYSIRLPDEIEAAASGHHVIINIIARASGKGQSRFAVAYSTNDVGNSDWCWFSTSAKWSVHTTEYDVPIMKSGNGDFIGILVEDKDHPSTEFCYLAITIS